MTMEVLITLPVLLDTLTQSLSSALEIIPEKSSGIIPKDGISLLDIKNDLLLSYIQNLVFLTLLKLRRHRVEFEEQEIIDLHDAVVRKLVELRLYLQKGVRPLEGRLKYQIDKVLRAADDFAMRSQPATGGKDLKFKNSDQDDAGHHSEDSGDSEAESVTGITLKASEINDLHYRPQPSFMVKPVYSFEDKPAESGRDKIYRPPRITATAMPTTHPKDKDSRKTKKSATLDEFVNTELSSAPYAEPSIGSTIVARGQRTKSEREKRDEAERQEYEEKNYVRLPKESKKDRAKKGGRRDIGYGGEEWRGLGEGIDRIEKLTKRKSGQSISIPEKSRKRSTDDRPRADGVGAEFGQGLLKKVKSMDNRRRDRGRK